MFRRPLAILSLAASLGFSQSPEPQSLKVEEPVSGEFTITPGTKIPLSLINSISTKHSLEGDRVYLETAFPVTANGRIVIPKGSSVAGTVTRVVKPGRVKGRGELYVRFDQLILPNGVTRDFRARMGGLDAQAAGELDRAEGKVTSEGNKAGDLRTVAETAGTGASIGAIAGAAGGRPGMGLGIGSAAGVVGGLIGVLATRGPDAVLTRGTTVEMVLDRPIAFSNEEINFAGYQPPSMVPAAAAPATDTQQQNGGIGGILGPRRRVP